MMGQADWAQRGEGAGFRPRARALAKAIRHAAILTLLLVGLPLSAAAREATPADKAALGEVAAAFTAAMRSADAVAIISTMPPSVMQHIADGAGMSVEALVADSVTEVSNLLSQVTIDLFALDVANADYSERTDGTPYALIPTVSRMSAKGQGVEVTSTTLAVLEQDRWFLLRIEDVQQLKIVKDVYPEFAGVEFPRGTMKAVEPVQ